MAKSRSAGMYEGLTPQERNVRMLKNLAKALAKPGIDRASILKSTTGKRVYAYFADSEDPTRLIREDVDGNRTVGRFSGGRFRPLKKVR